MIRSISNTDREILAQCAYSTFVQNQRLEIHVNRARSTSFESLPKLKKKATVFIERDKCLANVVPKIEKVASYYFSGLDGNIYYIDKQVLDRFRELAKAAFPNLCWTKRFAVVDKATDTELVSGNLVNDHYAIADQDASKVCSKIKTWIAHLPAPMSPTPADSNNS